ncbi:response regulator transcription factor [Alkalihalobacillus berkeleyi]|uniref:Heme response regulator HssR n=2 Tax=Pseudalkalibacillus berkeleyi TaxID=1069813 RepID=A0ABS9GUN5_9BACL|nr:response regulator transcription factor [Pseudalkalibacillus berkeleyi]
MMVHILVADDDDSILKLITVYLEKEGYKVIPAHNGNEAIKLLETEKVDLAVVDVMMPEKDGYEVCEEIRNFYDIPTLMLTAKGEKKDKLKGFESGTDDYVVKPFEPMEVVMRVKALLRRYQIQSSSRIQIGQIDLSFQQKEVTVNKQPIYFPVKEFDVLYLLASYPNQIFTRNQLIDKVWGADFTGDDRTVDVHIKRIREKLKPLQSGVAIKTIRGLGYRLEVTET